ncbi:type IV pilin [Methanococcoides sp. AM1]|uniref:type IV pilin n=1 Tax=Methanococcoides sp. AM1 TaxID=1201011 RepID=UPI00108285AF|nr:type IV pilin N-terminal domain-containing protein [Methanococcoides sp. AM1]
MFNINVNEDAVSPVVAEIMMVAVGIIVATIIIAFSLGLGTGDVAPQAGVRASSYSMGDHSVIMLEHQGGDELYLASSNTKMVVDGEVVDVTLLTTDDDLEFKAGESLYIFNEVDEIGGFAIGTATHLTNENAEGDLADIVAFGETGTVKFVDVSSQQMITDIDVRF